MDADTQPSEARPSSCRECEHSQEVKNYLYHEHKFGSSSMRRIRDDEQITHNQGSWLKQSEYSSMLEKGFI